MSHHHAKVARTLRQARSYILAYGHHLEHFSPDALRRGPRESWGQPVCAVGAIAVTLGTDSWWERHYATGCGDQTALAAQDALAKAAGLSSHKNLPGWSDGAYTPLLLETFLRAAVEQDRLSVLEGERSLI